MIPTVALTLASLLPGQPTAPKFEIKDGDRVVWIGNTLVEREQRYCYWETALHAAFPDKHFTFRNLGWSGDTVFGDARAGFDSPSKGYERLISLTLELKPTVIFISYGSNEAFEGESGLDRFEKGLEKLLNSLKPSSARIVLFSPLPLQRVANGPDVAVQNTVLAKYRDRIEKIASAHGHLFADLMTRANVVTAPSTDNGIHLNEDGYRHMSSPFLASLGLSAGKLDWEQYDAFRKATIEKNQLFFYKWRPQNETYLFGFRKHEQGKNAKEVAEFDPLVTKAEEEMEKLRKSLK